MASKFTAALALALAFTGTMAAPVDKRTGPGIDVTNSGVTAQPFCVFENSGGYAQWSNSYACQTINPGATAFFSLPVPFQGHVQHNSGIMATMGEFQLLSSGVAWGDISLEQGCDRSATVCATDGSNNCAGFSKNILGNAPAAAMYKRSDGWMALSTTMGNWLEPANQAAINYENSVVGQANAYITGGSGTKVPQSSNNRLAFNFYAGLFS